MSLAAMLEEFASLRRKDDGDETHHGGGQQYSPGSGQDAEVPRENELSPLFKS